MGVSLFETGLQYGPRRLHDRIPRVRRSEGNGAQSIGFGQ